MSLPLMVLFLAVGMVLLLISMYFGPRYFGRAKVANEFTALNELKANVRSYGARVGLFNAQNATLSALVMHNVFPASTVSGTVANPVVENQYGGGITVAVGTLMTAGDALTFTMRRYPSRDCAELGHLLDGIAGTIAINTTTIRTFGTGLASDPVAVSTACGTDDNATLILTIGKN